GYEHPDLAEATRLLCERIKSDVGGLKDFYTHAEGGQWAEACRELRKYYAATQKPDGVPDPNYDLARANAIVAGQLSHAGLARHDPPPIDWAWMKTTDWYEHKNFLNRGAAVGVLADAAYHTANAAWAGRFREVFYDWVNENPKPEVMRGPDYPTWRTLDTAARLGWLASRFTKVTATAAVDDELWANYLYSIWEHVDYLKNDDFSGGNWLATITSAVTDAAGRFPEFVDRRMWLEYGKTGFERNVMRDVHADGKEMEDAPGYICMAYGAMLATLRSLEDEGITTTAEVRQRLERVQDFLAAVTAPDGIMPSIGDWGGCEPYALPAAAEYFGRQDIHYVLSKGRQGVAPSFSSINFPQGGWTIMRSPYEERPYENARHLVFKTSSGSHGHFDVLAITAYAYGRPLLIDPGIASYEHEDIQRYLKTAYHNTVCIDGLNQPRWRGRTDAWFSNAAVDYVSGFCEEYAGLTHRRSILFVRPDYWVVSDRITGAGDHRYEQNWHFAADAAPSAEAVTKRVRTNHASGGNLLIVPPDGSEHECEAFDFFIAEQRMTGVKSNVPARGFRYAAQGPPPAAFDLVLYPYNGADAPGLSVETLTQDKGDSLTALKVVAGDGIDYVFMTTPGAGRSSFADADVAIDAEVLLIRTSAGKVRTLAGRDVCRVVFRGHTYVEQKDPAGSVCIQDP
ncbi:MAG: alginate lyase family protein, partial [Phycisphaerae bacterium]|nr:alginate lyase family protein [Phycisphaerae bacterium]